MNKQILTEFAEIAKKHYDSEKKSIELIQWASFNENRVKTMGKYLKAHPDASDAQIRYEMCRIVADEKLKIS